MTPFAFLCAACLFSGAAWFVTALLRGRDAARRSTFFRVVPACTFAPPTSRRRTSLPAASTSLRQERGKGGRVKAGYADLGRPPSGTVRFARFPWSMTPLPCLPDRRQAGLSAGGH